MSHLSRSLAIAGMAALMPAWAHAGCPDDGTMVFACTTETARQVEVCDRGGTFTYRYARPRGRIELAFTVPREQATLRRSHGGRFQSFSLSLPRRTWHYTVFWGEDRQAQGSTPSAGIDIETERNMNTIACRPDTVVHHLDRVDLPARPQHTP